MFALYKKWFTLMELIIVISVMLIIYLFSIEWYQTYVQGSLQQKRLENIRLMSSVFKDIIEKKWDIPKNYCTQDGISYSDDCFEALQLWCTREITCNKANNFCKNTTTSYYDFKKLFTDENFNLIAFSNIEWENYPEWLNYKLCPNSATDFAYLTLTMPKESTYMGTSVWIKNPSYVFKVFQNWVNKIINKSSYY